MVSCAGYISIMYAAVLAMLGAVAACYIVSDTWEGTAGGCSSILHCLAATAALASIHVQVLLCLAATKGQQFQLLPTAVLAALTAQVCCRSSLTTDVLRLEVLCLSTRRR